MQVGYFNSSDIPVMTGPGGSDLEISHEAIEQLTNNLHGNVRAKKERIQIPQVTFPEICLYYYSMITLRLSEKSSALNFRMYTPAGG